MCFHFELAGDILREETFALLEQAPPGAFQLEDVYKRQPTCSIRILERMGVKICAVMDTV